MLCRTCACNLNNPDVIASLDKQGVTFPANMITAAGVTQVQDCAEYNTNFKLGNMIS